MQVKTIKHFLLPEQTNQLYKKEAISSISLTKEVADKINELVDAFNNIIKYDLEKIHEQDGKINKAILYMKDELVNAIQDLLDIKGEGLIENYTKLYLGYLQAQLNNLLNDSIESTIYKHDIKFSLDSNFVVRFKVYSNVESYQTIEELFNITGEIIEHITVVNCDGNNNTFIGNITITENNVSATGIIANDDDDTACSTKYPYKSVTFDQVLAFSDSVTVFTSSRNNAELIDARLGYNSNQYNSVGEALRTQFINLRNASLYEVDLTDFVSDAFIRKSNGSIKTDAAGYRYSKPIEITSSKLYIDCVYQSYSDCDLINFYSSSELSETTFIGSFTPSNNENLIQVDIPNGATHFSVCTSDNLYTETHIFIGDSDLSYVKEEELSYKPINLEVDLDGYFIRANGSKVESTGMVISKPIEIIANKMYFKGHNKNYSSTSLIHFYSNTEVSFYGYISSYQPTSSLLQEIEIPEGAKYFRICTGANQLPLTKIYFSNDVKPQIYKSIKDITSRLILADRTYNIKIIGDSIANGYGGTGYTNNSTGELIYGSNYTNPNGYCWANELKKYLENKFDCVVKNYGVSGVGSDVLLSKMSNVINEDDDIIICFVGTNDRVVGKDAYTGVTKTLESIYKNMNGIYTYAKRLGKEIIFISPIPSSISDEANRTYHTEDIANLYTKLSFEKGIEIIPMHQLLCEYCDMKSIELDSLLDDGLHPNDEGYRVMYEIICRKLGFNPKRKNSNW